MASSKGNGANWVDALNSIQAKRGKAPPGDGVGWLRFLEICELYNAGENKMRKLVQIGVENGSIKVFEGSGLNGAGRLTRRIWYKMKQ